jgi:hypothetical protein
MLCAPLLLHDSGWFFPLVKGRFTMIQKLAPLAILALVAIGCRTVVPPASPAPELRPVVPVAAGFNETWYGVMTTFADRNIPIQTLDRSSGFISTENLFVGPELGRRGVADCGGYKNREAVPYDAEDAEFYHIFPTHAIYNVLVRGDSTASTVKVTVKWVHLSSGNILKGDKTIECVSSYSWEEDLESRIREVAEGVSKTGIPKDGDKP